LTGTNHGGDAVTQGAKIALRSAFLNAAGRLGPTLVVGGALGGRLLTPGVYKDNGAPASLGLTGILRLDAQGDPKAVFIFQSASTLITEVGSGVVLLNGAQACNVFWQVGSAATLKTSTTFVGTILANDDISLQASVTVAGRLLAGAQANGAGALTLINNTITTPVCSAPAAAADLIIGKSHSGNFAPGQIGAAYTLAASNVGTASTAGTVTVRDTLPAGLSATAISGTGWSCTLSSLSCTRSDALAAGASYMPITVTVNVASNAPATVINTATISGGGELNLSNNSASDTTTITQIIITAPDLTITKNHSGNFQQGGIGSYTLTVRNLGTAPTTGTVNVSDALPAGLSAAIIGGTGWSCTLTSLSCTRSDSLAAGASYAPITVTVNVASNAPETVINTTTVSGGGELYLSNNSASDTTIIETVTTTPDLTITKNHSGNFQQGGIGSYTLTVRNVGAAPTTGTVTVSDILPAGLSATTISGTGWSCALTSLSCTRSDALAAGASYAPITVTVNVTSDPLIFSQVGDGLTFQAGEILLSMQNGTVQWRRRDWTLVKTITSVTDGHAKGMAFDASGNLFLTHYFGSGLSGNAVVKFDRTGYLIGLFGSGYDCNPSAIVLDKTGNAYIGHADCSGDILKLDSQGNRLAQYDVAVENRGTSHILLDPDQCTMYYTSQGSNVKRFNTCTNTQMSDFNRTALPDAIGGAHQFALLPGGGLLVANFGVIAALDASGNLVRTYDSPADTHCWLGMVLDPDGASFWATNWCGSSATRFDMVTGGVIESHVAADRGFMVKQIIVVPPSLRSAVVVNTAAVSGGGEMNTNNNSASDSTTIIAQPQTPVLSIGSTAHCVGAAWSLGVSNALPNASVRLTGTTNGLPWVIAEWTTTDANGNSSLGGTFAEGTQGSYTLRVEIDRKISNTISFAISNCGPTGG